MTDAVDILNEQIAKRDARIAELGAALRQAREDMEGWAAYVSDYFTEKHDLASDLAAIDAALTTEPQP